MNTTKKDVQDEKLYFIQSFDAMPKVDKPPAHSPDQYEGSNGHEVEGASNNDIVDINDVELTLMPSYFGSENAVAENGSRGPRRPPRSTRDMVIGELLPRHERKNGFHIAHDSLMGWHVLVHTHNGATD
jgi:hypothetical protein